MPPAFILSQDQTLHERKERPVDSGSTYSKLGSPRATRAGRSAHSIALSGFQGAGRLPEGEPQEVRRFRRGAYSKPVPEDCKPGWEDFSKKTRKRGFPAPPGAFFPGCRTAESPRGARPRAPATHYPLHSPPYSLPQDTARRNRRAGRAHARQPRTTFSILLPTLYFCVSFR